MKIVNIHKYQAIPYPDKVLTVYEDEAGFLYIPAMQEPIPFSSKEEIEVYLETSLITLSVTRNN
jgi:hypothetical protein